MDIVSCAEAGGWMTGKVGSWGAGFVRLHFAPSDMFDEWTTLELLPGVGKWMASSSTDVDGDGRERLRQSSLPLRGSASDLRAAANATVTGNNSSGDNNNNDNDGHDQ